MANALTRSTLAHAVNGCFLFPMHLKVVSSNGMGFDNVRFACSLLAHLKLWQLVPFQVRQHSYTFIQTSRHSVTFVSPDIG
jgi:hypothetical protein